MCLQDGDGMEGASEEDGGMYSEEQEIEQYEYTDDPGLEGADDDDAAVEPQGSDLQTDVAQTDLQDEDELAELEFAGAPEGDDDVEDQAEAPTDYQVLVRAATLVSFVQHMLITSDIADMNGLAIANSPTPTFLVY